MLVSFGFSVLYVDGSAALHPYATSIGVNNPFYTFKGADHVPYLTNLAYMDTTVNFVRDFLRPLLPITPNAVIENNAFASVSLFPNPAKESISVYFDKTNFGTLSGALYDVSGRVIRNINMEQSPTIVEQGNLATGIYYLKLVNQKQDSKVLKVSFY